MAIRTASGSMGTADVSYDYDDITGLVQGITVNNRSAVPFTVTLKAANGTVLSTRTWTPREVATMDVRARSLDQRAQPRGRPAPIVVMV